MDLNDLLEEIATIKVTIVSRCQTINLSNQVQAELDEVMDRAKKTHRNKSNI